MTPPSSPPPRSCNQPHKTPAPVKIVLTRAGAAFLACVATARPRTIVAMAQLEHPPRLGIVVPAKDPGVSFDAHLSRLLRLAQERTNVEVVVVDDGSVRGDLAPRVPAPAMFLRHESNRGKGAALRTGFIHLLGLGYKEGDLLGFIDADGDIAAEEFFRLAELSIGTSGAVGAKTLAHRSSLLRATTSAVFAGLVRLLVPTGMDRTQVGVKVFDAGFLGRALPHTQEEGFLLDVELLAYAYRNHVPLSQVGVAFTTAATESTVRPKHVRQMALGLLKISVRTRRGRRLRQ